MAISLPKLTKTVMLTLAGSALLWSCKKDDLSNNKTLIVGKWNVLTVSTQKQKDDLLLSDTKVLYNTTHFTFNFTSDQSGVIKKDEEAPFSSTLSQDNNLQLTTSSTAVKSGMYHIRELNEGKLIMSRIDTATVNDSLIKTTTIYFMEK
jgi:hypothetical protein